MNTANMGLGTELFEGKRVLITGANGFIGTHLCRRIYELGGEVHGISRDTRGTEEAISKWWQLDLADMEAVRRVFSTVMPEIVFHMASRVTGARAMEEVLPTFQSNLTSTVNILLAATEMKSQRIVLCGSLEEPEPEDGILVPCSPYAAAKFGGNVYANMFNRLYGTPVTVARLYMVYGPGQKDLKKLVPYVTLACLRGEQPRLSAGTRPVDWVYVGDVVDGLARIAGTPGIDGLTLDIGSGELETVRSVVEKIVKLTGGGTKPVFGVIPDRPAERVRVANISETLAKLDWKPRVTTDMGLAETVHWYREHFIHSES